MTTRAIMHRCSQGDRGTVRLARVSALVVTLCACLHSQSRLLDDFESLEGWKQVVSEGASANLLSASGKSGKALVLEFDLSRASGYAIARRELPVDLPSNYQFTFDMKAEAPVNNFEFKLVDSLGNVWWIKKLNVTYPTEWTKQRVKKRHITFAWGPSGGGELKHAKAVELVVSSGTGGHGRVYFDNFRFEEIDDSKAAAARPAFHTSSKIKNSATQPELKNDLVKRWTAASGTESFTIDFGYQKEIGGLVFEWAKGREATAYKVLLSDDSTEWTTASSVTLGNGGRDYVFLGEQEGRFLKIVCTKDAGKGYLLETLKIMGPEIGASGNIFFGFVAGKEAPGLYPAYFLKKQNYWTIVGAAGDSKEALINETGAVEVDQSNFSIEPFLFTNKKLVTWNDVQTAQSLEKDYLPIPTVTWSHTQVRLTIRAFAAGESGRSVLYLTYGVSAGEKEFRGTLFLALRPFQVNPPWQWLNRVGGVSHIDSISSDGGILLVNEKTVIPLTPASAFGAMSFAQGDITEYLNRGKVPISAEVRDGSGLASGALAYDIAIPAGARKEIHLAIPFHSRNDGLAPFVDGNEASDYVEKAFRATRAAWETELDKFHVELPKSAQNIINTVRSNLAYIFINQDGPGIQPGSRSYERSWMRDGSLTATALLQTDIRDKVREYIDWYAGYQFPSGKIPCVVDARGADPTNEHDSHGQFIYLIKQYFNYTADTTWLRGKFDAVVRTVRYIQSLRAERKTAVYRDGTPEQRACYGLVPESISHEGYSAKPMHSYWDDFFVLRGLKDAAAIADILGEQTLEKEFAAERDDFRNCLYASMHLSMKNHGIDYIPGCVELGDFDATSTTIGVVPGGELSMPTVGVVGIPEPQLHNTFDRYYDYFAKRKSNTIPWKDYTPYETRVIGTFVHLGQKDRAHEAVEFFMKDRRPAAWNHWAEVVHRDPATPAFIGDMPHTWVGSDFIRSVRSMFVYEREQDGAVIIGAGIKTRWMDEGGVKVNAIPTYHGNLSYSMSRKGRIVVVELSGPLTRPAGKIILRSPLDDPLASVKVNGAVYNGFTAQEVMLDSLPATVELHY
ncbi:MAG: discoidin domain-containing protein [Bacteroidota bacterium]